MPRIAPLAAGLANPATQTTLNAVKARLGMVPNLFATYAQAPAVLNAHLAFSEALGQGRLSASQREIVALAVGQANACQYCLSAHTLLGKAAGLSDAAILAARQGSSADPLNHAIADLAVRIVRQRGVLTDTEFADVRAAGLDDGLILEITANVALNVLTNYTNHIAATTVDFPLVSVGLPA